MKTYTKSVLSLVTALTISAWPSVTSAGGNGAKGGAADLMRPPTYVPGATTEKAMSCPMCKDDVSVKKEWTERGAFKFDKPVARHLCNECSTTAKTVGTGKQAMQIASHTCMACKN